MKLSAHTESNSTAKGFLTYFTEVNGYGDWHRRWCVLKDLTLYFWKYPEDEQKRKAPIEVNCQGFNNYRTWRDQCQDPAINLKGKTLLVVVNNLLFSVQYKSDTAELLQLKPHPFICMRNFY